MADPDVVAGGSGDPVDLPGLTEAYKPKKKEVGSQFFKNKLGH